MISRKVDNTYILRLDRGDDIIPVIKEFCEQNNITAGIISGFGVAGNLKLICFDGKTRTPKTKSFEGDYEITSLLGNISYVDNELFPHLHITLVDYDFKAFGGHLVEGKIGLTGEIFIQTLNTRIDRIKNEETGINIINL